jgi:formamidopyrimidine-DNA glycosylase
VLGGRSRSNQQSPAAQIKRRGQNLFNFFANAPTLPQGAPMQQRPGAHEVMHIHFGMSGTFETMSPPGNEPAVTTKSCAKNGSLNAIGHLIVLPVGE